MFNEVFSEKTAQVSLVSGVLFFIIASRPVFKMVEDLMKKTLNISLKGVPQLVFHSLLFSLLVGLLTFFVFRPILGWNNTEGLEADPCPEGWTMNDVIQQCVEDGAAAAPPPFPGDEDQGGCVKTADCPRDEYCDLSGGEETGFCAPTPS